MGIERCRFVLFTARVWHCRYLPLSRCAAGTADVPHTLFVPLEQLLPSDATTAVILATLSTSELAPMNAAASHAFETSSHALAQLPPG